IKQPTSANGTGKWREPSRCEKLVLCEFSHTLLEQMYHPHIYKTSLCSNFNEAFGNETIKQNCLWGNLCTHAHGKSDLRQRNDQTKIFSYDNFVKKTPKISETKGKSFAKIAKSPEKLKNEMELKLSETIYQNVLMKPTKEMSFSDALRSGCSLNKNV
ncbi:hypothetical protein MHBO_004242, partial [Bonamia ostreae]